MTGKMSLYYKAHFLNPSPNRIWVIALCLSVFISSGTQQSDTKRQHLLERLLDAVKQVRFPLCPCICMFEVEGHKMTFGCLLKSQSQIGLNIKKYVFILFIICIREFLLLVIITVYRRKRLSKFYISPE